MFYRGIPLIAPDSSARPQAAAMVTLTSAESKRLIARGVAALPEVQLAREEGYIIIARGTTNAFVAEELLGVRLEKVRYAAGIIFQGQSTVSPRERWLRPYVLHRGQPAEVMPEAALKEFGPHDVFIKGANAVDGEGNAGILVAGPEGGTIGAALPTLEARGSHLIMPVGLEKLVPSVLRAAPRCGVRRFKYSTGMPLGLVPVVTASVITEVQALHILAGVAVTHVASGGIGGSEGAVTLALEGDEAVVDRAWELLSSIKGEAPVAGPS